MTGFLFDSLAQDQHLLELTRHVRATGAAATVYARHVAGPWADPPFPVSNWADAWGAKFPLVAADFEAASALVRFPAPARRAYWVRDLEWTRHRLWGGQPPPYGLLAGVFRHPSLRLVARCEAHARAVREAFNVPVEIMTAFSMEYFDGKSAA